MDKDQALEALASKHMKALHKEYKAAAVYESQDIKADYSGLWDQIFYNRYKDQFKSERILRLYLNVIRIYYTGRLRVEKTLRKLFKSTN